MGLSHERLSQHRPTAPASGPWMPWVSTQSVAEKGRWQQPFDGSHTATGGIAGLTLNMI